MLTKAQRRYTHLLFLIERYEKSRLATTYVIDTYGRDLSQAAAKMDNPHYVWQQEDLFL